MIIFSSWLFIELFKIVSSQSTPSHNDKRHERSDLCFNNISHINLLSFISIVRFVIIDIYSSWIDKRIRRNFIWYVFASISERERSDGIFKFGYWRIKRAIAPYVSSFDICNEWRRNKTDDKDNIDERQ